QRFTREQWQRRLAQPDTISFAALTNQAREQSEAPLGRQVGALRDGQAVLQITSLAGIAAISTDRRVVSPLSRHLQCDGRGCLLYDHDQQPMVLMTEDIGALQDDCGLVPIILMTTKSRRQQPVCTASTVIGRYDLRDSLGLAFHYEKPDGDAVRERGYWRVDRTIDIIGQRPWLPLVKARHDNGSDADR
ncbi:MAG: hypothetical protein AAF213_10800, partial [Pseudomonadota bacterium]